LYRESKQSAGFFKTQTRIPGMEPRAVSISDIAQEIGSDVGQREELLTLVSGMFARLRAVARAAIST
jgi:hypothetical protein